MARTKKSESVPVRIRFKELENGNKSIYLDIYYEKKRRYEFLKLYLVPENSAEARAQNEHTLKAANAIKSQRIIDITNKKPQKDLSDKAKVLLTDWLQVYSKKRTKEGKTSVEKVVHSTVKQLERYAPKAMLCDVDKSFLEGFVQYMTETKSHRTNRPFGKKTISNLLACIIAALGLAVEEGVLSFNPAEAVDRKAIQGEKKKREYLTIDEVKMLIDTPCASDDVKKAFLFSCFCGLRISDVRALLWKDVIYENDKTHLELRQKKTEALLYLPLNKQAQCYLPANRGNVEECVFSLPSQSTISKILDRWAKDAGISKKVCYHMSRHTFATMELTMGADLYTTSLLMGHSNVQITQIYAKIIDVKKEQAVMMIDALFDEP